MAIRLVRITTAVSLLLASAGVHAVQGQSADGSERMRSDPEIAAWLSVGLGPGWIRGDNSSSFAGVARATVSVGSFLASYRASDVGPFFSPGSGVQDRGVLVGMRTRGHRFFVSASAGYATAHHYHGCESCGGIPSDPGVGVLAYDVTTHANLYVPGIGISLSGNLGPSRVAQYAMTVAFELGWFGK